MATTGYGRTEFPLTQQRYIELFEEPENEEGANEVVENEEEAELVDNEQQIIADPPSDNEPESDEPGLEFYNNVIVPTAPHRVPKKAFMGSHS